MKTIMHLLFIGIALLVGVAIGYIAGAPSPIPAADGGSEPVAARTIPDKGNEATIAALRRQVDDLQKTLRKKDDAVRAPATSDAVFTNALGAVRAEMPRHSPRHWLEEMKRTDPERYAQTTNRIAQWRRHRAEQARSTVDFLSSLDVSGMDEAAKKTHADVQQLILRRDAIESQMQQEDLGDEERGRLLQDMWQTTRDLVRLNGDERKNLFDATARVLGFDGQDVDEITETLLGIVDATSLEKPFRHGGVQGTQNGRHN